MRWIYRPTHIYQTLSDRKLTTTVKFPGKEDKQFRPGEYEYENIHIGHTCKWFSQVKGTIIILLTVLIIIVNSNRSLVFLSQTQDVAKTLLLILSHSI